MTPTEIKQVVIATLQAIGYESPKISQAKARKTYGRLTLDRWVEKGLIKPEVKGKRKHFKTLELIDISHDTNRTSQTGNIVKRRTH